MFNKTKKSLIALLAAIFAAALLCVGVSLLTPKAQKAYASSGVSDVVQVTINSGTPQSYVTFNAAITDINNISNGNIEIKLLGNATATKELSSSNSAKHFTLDLNGHALTVNAPVKCARLTLKDGMAGTTDSAYLHEISNPTTADTADTVQIYGGVLTNPSGRALIVGSTYKVTMESGTIAGCAGSGVYVNGADAIFTMSGGTISYNTDDYGGGVYVGGNGTFEMNGGTISNNTATTTTRNGGGVCVSSSATFNIFGAPKIKDNKRSTDDHAKGVTSYNGAIKVNAALTAGAEIYIDGTVKITGYTQSEKPSQYFKSDDPTKCAQAGVNGDVALSAHTGGKATCKAKAVCEHCGESYGELAPHNYVDGVCTVCGAKIQIYWGVDGGKLTISGVSGTVATNSFDYDAVFGYYDSAPWYNDRASITSVEVDGENGVAPVSLKYWFNGCSELMNIDLSGLNTSYVTDMFSMFSGCTKLASLDLSRFDTAKVTDMSDMFFQCSALTSLDLSSFDFANVTNMRCMFRSCTALSEIIFPTEVNAQKVTAVDYMFENCKGITTIDLSAFKTQELTNMSRMFTGCSLLTSVTFPASFDTSKVTNMSLLFQSCTALTSPGISGFNTQSVTTMENLFADCAGLTSINLANWNVQNVTNMKSMFNGCLKLTEITFPDVFNTANVTDMSFLFSRCGALKKIDLSSFKTESLTVMEGMFYTCGALEEVNLSSFDAQNVTNANYMFYGCNALNKVIAPAKIGESFSTALPSTKFWNGAADVTYIDGTGAGKTFVKHDEHSLTAVAQKNATCTEAGVLAHDHCGVCGKDFIENVEKSAEQLAIAKTAHEWEAEFTVDKAATCTENGSKSKHCKRCDSKTEVTEIPAGHHITHHGAVDATTDNAGNYEYWSCADCDTYFSDSEGTTEITDKASVVIPKLPTKSEPQKKSYVWICWLLIPLAVAVGGVTYGIYLYKKKKRM